MIIDPTLNPALISFAKPWIEAASKYALEKAKSKFLPNELEKALTTAISAATANESRQPDPLWLDADNEQYKKFISSFLEHSITRQEIQKPLDQAGLLDISLLVNAVVNIAQSVGLNSGRPRIDRWTRSFAETYTQETNAVLRFQTACETYCHRLLQQCEDVQFLGFAIEDQEVERAEKLLEIFVMPDLREEVQEIYSSFPSDSVRDPQTRALIEQRLQVDKTTSKPKVSAATLLDTKQTNRAIVIGGPGSGKTTLLKYFAARTAILATRSTSEPDQQIPGGRVRLPILVQIQDLAKHLEKSILEYARWYAETELGVKALPADFFEYWIENGQAVILLDGLDEVIDKATRQKVVARIRIFLDANSSTPAIITSRPSGYRRDFFNSEKFKSYIIQAFDDPQVDEFIDLWYTNRSLTATEADRQKAKLRSAIAGNPRIKALARTPILLTLIALLHRHQLSDVENFVSSQDENVATLEK